MKEKIWFAKSPQAKLLYGPYSSKQMRQALQIGKLKNDYLVSHDQETWRCIGDILSISATKKLSIEDAFLDATIFGEQKEKFDNYQLLDELGRGGMGIVYKALDKRVNRTVALKVLLSKGGDQRQLLRFIREGQLTAQLRHPNIVSLYEVGEHPKPHFSMDYIQGQPLNDIIRENALTTRQIVILFCKICAGIEYAHHRKIIHRDIKPANILIDLQGEPKITDFGIAKSLEAEQDISYSGEILGTPKYMSPEQANGKKVDARADIYSLGAVFYELLTGRPPFDGNSVLNILSQLANNDPIPPRDLNPGIPIELETICLSCLQKSPPKRYLTVKLLRRDLDRFLANRPVSVRPPGYWERSVKWIKRNKAISAFGALLLLSGILLVLMLQESQRGEALATKNLKLAKKNFSLKTQKQKLEQGKLDKENQLKIATITFNYQKGCELFQQKKFKKSNTANTLDIYKLFDSIVDDLSNCPISSATYKAYWMQGCVFFIQQKYNSARQNFLLALPGYQSSDEKTRLQLLLTLCACELGDIPAARDYLIQAKQIFYHDSANQHLKEFLPRLNAIPGELSPIPFRLPVDRRKLTKKGARYYLIAHLLPKEMRIDARIQLFTDEKIPLNCLVAQEILTLDYLLSGSRTQWIDTMLSQLSFSEIKAVMVRLQGKWVLDMASPYWTHLPLSLQRKYSAQYQQAYARQLGTGQVKDFAIDNASFSLALIPPGQFIMGRPYAQNDAGPATLACISKHFWMAQTEVTQQQWNEVLKKTKWRDVWRKYSKKHPEFQLTSPRNPALWIAWKGIQKFIICIGRKNFENFFSFGYFDLPSELQWEYCCKAATTSLWYWAEYTPKLSDTADHLIRKHHEEYMWFEKNSLKNGYWCPQNVKIKKPNAWLLYDMSGNVGEICKNRYMAYSKHLTVFPSVNKVDIIKTLSMVYRGGHYASSSRHCSSTTRAAVPAINMNNIALGFRFIFIPR